MKKRYYLYLLSAVLILAYYFRIYRIDGTSMNYQLLQNDIVIAYRQFADIKRGDILVMRHPLDPENRLYIKRCAALPKDKVFEKARSFYLQIESNSSKTKMLGQRYDLELVHTTEGYFIKDPYLKYYGVVHNWRLRVPHELDHTPITIIPPAHYYMLGDYRDNSTDSRFFGAVPRSWIYSKVIYIFHHPLDWLTLLQIKEADDTHSRPQGERIREIFKEDTKR